MISQSSDKFSHSYVPEEILSLIAALTDFFSGREIVTYIVGGFLRDVLIGRITSDIDLAVKGDAISLARDLANELGGKFVLLDERRAIARVIFTTESRFQKVEANPQYVVQKTVDLRGFTGDITWDLSRRDFTIDAMALPLDNMLYETLTSNNRELITENLVDPFNGIADLRTAKIRAVSNDIFMNDPIRLLRCVRLVAQLHFSIEHGTREIVEHQSHLLQTMASERLRDELLRTLAEPNSSSHLRLMDELGLLCNIIPEMEDARGVEQPKEHYWDVLYHCIATPGQVEHLTTVEYRMVDEIVSCAPWHSSLGAYFDEEISDGHTRRTIIKMAGLLHDISKPSSKTIDSTGRIRFLGHDSLGSEICKEILRRLRFSNRGIDLISAIVRHHLRPTQMSHDRQMPTPRAIYRYYRDLGEAAIDTLYLNMADYLAAKGPSIEINDWQSHCKLVGYVLDKCLEANTKPQKPQRLLDGNLIMESLGLSQSALIGRLLDAVQEEHEAGNITTQEEALHLVRELASANKRPEKPLDR